MLTADDFRAFQRAAEDPDTSSAELARIYTKLLDERVALATGRAKNQRQRVAEIDAFTDKAMGIWSAILLHPNVPSEVYDLIEDDELWITAIQNPGFDLEMLVNPKILRTLYLAEMRAVTGMFRNGTWPESQAFLKELVALAKKHGIGTSCTKAFLQAIEEAPKGTKLSVLSAEFYTRMQKSKVCSADQLDRLFQMSAEEGRMIKNLEVVRALAAAGLEAPKPATFYHDLGRFLAAQGKPSRKGVKLVYKPLREDLE